MTKLETAIQLAKIGFGIIFFAYFAWKIEVVIDLLHNVSVK